MTKSFRAGGCAGSNYPFLTAKERDVETGLDYFGARYYASAQGRFTSADSYAGRLVNPQTLNLYTYVRNNPVKYVDPTGDEDENPKKKGKKGKGDEDEEFLNTEDTPRIVVINSEPSLLGAPPRPPTLTRRITQASFEFNTFMMRQGLRFAGSGPLIMAAEALLPKAWVDEWHSPGVQIPLMMSVVGSPLAIEAGTEEATAAMEGEMDALLEGTLFRNGAFTEMNFTPRARDATTGLSTFDTLEAATAPGDKAQVIDVSQFTNLKAVPNGPPGHYGIFPKGTNIQEWISTRGETVAHELTRELMNARTHEVRRPK